MRQSPFSTIHQGRRWRAVVAVKAALVLVFAVLVWWNVAGTLSPAGTLVFLFHAGALLIIAFVLMLPAMHRSITARSHPSSSEEPEPPHAGILLHSAASYDILAKILTFGREHALREQMLSFATLKPREAVLDVGCGTGTVAMLAKKKVGPEGRVEGVDPSIEMIARAKTKARRAGLEIAFSNATAQHLPYRDGEFDIVLSTLMLHHLPRAGRAEFGKEAMRVLKPGGRMLIVDFAKPPTRKRTFRLHRHGHTDLGKVAADIGRAGFRIVELGDVGTKGLRYLIACRDDDALPPCVVTIMP